MLQFDHRHRVHIGCIRSRTAPGQIGRVPRTNGVYAGNSRVWSNGASVPAYPDKEEVPGSNPGSPTLRSPVDTGDSRFWRRARCRREAGMEALWKPAASDLPDRPTDWGAARVES